MQFLHVSPFSPLAHGPVDSCSLPQIELELTAIYGKRTERVRQNTGQWYRKPLIKGLSIEVLRLTFFSSSDALHRRWKSWRCTDGPNHCRPEWRTILAFKVAIGREIQRYFAPWVCGRPFLADFQSTPAQILNGSTNPGQEIRQKELHYAWIYLGIRAFSSALLYISPSFAMLAVLLMMLGLNSKKVYNACELLPQSSSSFWVIFFIALAQDAPAGQGTLCRQGLLHFHHGGLVPCPTGWSGYGFLCRRRWIDCLSTAECLCECRWLVNDCISVTDVNVLWKNRVCKSEGTKHLGSLIWRSNLKMPWWANSLLQ